PLTEVLVEDEVTWTPAPVADEHVTPGVEFETSSDEAVVLRVSTPVRAVLVLTDLSWPGWRVTVDDEERPIHRVDYLFRGVAVEPGAHVVRFWYDPVSVKLGFAISAGTLVLLIAARVLRVRRAPGGAGAASPAGSGA
ncbi:MAG TPA: YfhO family protein, partial [Candidatus Binatia bacterium]|nr:YfhO family protein [Candidatus Binatia bacterium]